MFELRNVTKKFDTNKFGSTLVVENLTYTFLPGVSYGIMGPSGTGKSTLLYLLAGLEQPTEGAVFFDGVNISKKAQKNRDLHEQFLLKSVGLVFQAPYLIPELSIIENIGIKGLIMGMSQAEISDRATYLLEHVSLTDIIYQPVMVLSGGQQQRIALARALFYTPKFLLLDEPTAHIDTHTAHEMLIVLQKIQKNEHVGCIVVSHDPLVAQAMDFVLYMRDGKLHEREIV